MKNIIETFNSKKHHNKLIGENFFVFDSNNLETIRSHMYGFCISENGILTENYYKKIKYYEDPSPQGSYILIRKIGDEIRINQDFLGSYGLYIYENKNKEYFALSNSFLLLEEFLIEKQNMSFNKDFADNLIISGLCSPSIHETLIKEIIKLPSNTVVIINKKKKAFQLLYIDYKENTIPLESEEGLLIIDKWVDKWGYIFRSLRRKTNNLSFDLSGGFDTRLVLSLLISSGIDMNDILIKSITDKKYVHKEDFKIASNISKTIGFKLNEKRLDNKSTLWSTQNTLFCSIYSKLGFHKEFYLKNQYFSKPRFSFTGNGGEIIRGKPGYDIKMYLEKISSQAKQIPDYEKEFYNSSMRLCNRSIDLLKKEKTYNNEYEVSSDFYFKGRARNHFGKSAIEGFLANIYLIQPLIDPDIKKIKFNTNSKKAHDFISYIYLRFGKDLIYFHFQGNRTLNSESIKKAVILNNKIQPYKIKTDLNKNFYIDNKRKSPAFSSHENKNGDDFLKEIFKTNKVIKNINKLYNNGIYKWAKNYSFTSNYFPLRHIYSLLAVSKILDDLSRNEKFMKKK